MVRNVTSAKVKISQDLLFEVSDFIQDQVSTACCVCETDGTPMANCPSCWGDKLLTRLVDEQGVV